MLHGRYLAHLGQPHHLSFPHRFISSLLHTMEKITPFDIPLLNNEICQYLSRKELSRCTQVSKTWSAWFTPALWRDLDCYNGTPDLDALSKQQEHVRTIRSLSMTVAGSMRDQLSFPNLQTLEFTYTWNGNGIHRIELRVLRVVERIQTLRHLKISISLDHYDVYQQFVRMLQVLPCLEKLELTCQQYVGGMVIAEILQLCRRYEHLGLDFTGNNSYIQQEDREECEAAKTAIKQMQDLQLRGLNFGTTFALYEENILQPLLQHCPLIQKLHLWRPVDERNLLQLSRIFKEKCCPELQHWQLRGIYGDGLHTAHAEILRHIGGGLKSFVIDNDPGHAATKALIQHHAHSLTKLDLTGTRVELVTFSDLMASLPVLRSVKIYARVESTDEDFDLAIEKQWACVDLRILSLCLETPHSMNRVINGRHWKGSTSQRCLDYVFSQIKKLKDLEELRLGCSQSDLFLMRRGYLSRLAVLKQLKVFDIDRAPPTNFGVSEALWMIANWPRLVHVHDRGAPDIFRVTLQEQRPLLQTDSVRRF